jgi:hypothetical protein
MPSARNYSIDWSVVVGAVVGVVGFILPIGGLYSSEPPLAGSLASPPAAKVIYDIILTR